MDKDNRRVIIKKVEFIKAAYRNSDFLDDLPQIALAGRSNCGKSTLINALLNRKKLAKVSSTPGYTKSVNFILVNEDFYLVDLPGFGFAKRSKHMKKLWEKIISDYLETSKNLKGVLHLIDIRRLITEKDMQLIEYLNLLKIPYLLVFTKIDKLSKNQISKSINILKKEYSIENFVLTSGLRKVGIEELWEQIFHILEK